MAYKQRPGTWKVRGRPFKISRGRCVRDILRRHARLQGLTLPQAFQAAWDMDKPRAVWDRFMRKNQPLSPWHIDRACEELKLLPEERHELMLQGARECGWDV
jgi:hypothetical protein